MAAIRILDDADVDRLLPMKDAIEVIEGAFRAKAEGHLVTPPRRYVEFAKGSLVFTVGGEDRDGGAIGFRVYDAFPGDDPRRTQATFVYEADSGALRGVVTGHRLGTLRTSAIGGVALKHLARPDAHRLGFLGTGGQAWGQLEAALAVLPIRSVQVHSPTAAHRERFAEKARSRFPVEAQACPTAREVVEGSDVVICSTTSERPVLDSAWVRPGLHVTSMGAKTKQRQEVDAPLGQRAEVIATDAPAQMTAYDEPYFLEGTPAWDRIADLAQVVVGRRAGRSGPQQVSLFLSEGLAGTEVLVAAAALARDSARA